MMTATEQGTVTLTRYADSTRSAKAMRDASRVLEATEVVLRACGQWLDERGEVIDLTDMAVPIRGVKSVWIEAVINTQWIHLRPNSDPHLALHQVPKIEIEATFKEG